jgi:hypothetical protein
MGSWVHRLTNVDLARRTAVCAKCGSVTIRLKGNGSGSLSPRCGERCKEDSRRARRRRDATAST